MADLRQGTITPANGYHRLGAFHHYHVPRFTQVGHYRDLHIWIGRLAAASGEDADGQSALSAGPSAGGFHYATQPSTDEDGILSGQLPPHFFR